MQHITFAHWLPSILGEEGMRAQVGPYRGYNASEDASVSNVFAASAFRFGHAMINPELRRLGPDFAPIAEGNLPLSKAFFRDINNALDFSYIVASFHFIPQMYHDIHIARLILYHS